MSGDGDPGFSLSESHAEGSVVLAVHGDLDIAAAAGLAARLAELGAQRVPVLLDLSPVEFMDSSGLACIVQAMSAARAEEWDLRVGRELSPQVKRLIELVSGEALFWPTATS